MSFTEYPRCIRQMSSTPNNAAPLTEKNRTTSERDNFSQLDSSRGIDVVRAEEEFNALSRQLSGPSDVHRKRSQLSTTTVGDDDVEKGVKDGEEREHFDLREYLSSSNDANQQAGIKHKVCEVGSYLRAGD